MLGGGVLVGGRVVSVAVGAGASLSSSASSSSEDVLVISGVAVAGFGVGELVAVAVGSGVSVAVAVGGTCVGVSVTVGDGEGVNVTQAATSSVAQSTHGVGNVALTRVTPSTGCCACHRKNVPVSERMTPKANMTKLLPHNNISQRWMSEATNVNRRGVG